ncbi:MAG: hypothetical protein IPP82_12595 [Xanthomonadales bacterium]|nr:hypothetical protein [Xanthomonadales bacterium]
MANDEVGSLAIDVDGSVYVGGFFGSIGGANRTSLAKLSGTNGAADAIWSPFGCAVTSLILDGNGALFTDGWCTQKISTTGAGARIGWNPLPNGEVTALALDASGSVYLGGSFTVVAGQPRSGLAAVPPNLCQKRRSPLINNAAWDVTAGIVPRRNACGSIFVTRIE